MAKSDADLDVVESIGWKRTALGWAVFIIRSQGMKVLSTELLNEPELRSIAAERFKIEVVRHFILPGVRGDKS